MSLTLGQVIARLEREPADKPVERGFGRPNSYRGYYEELAFEPTLGTTAGEMLAHARSALRETFQGYKGGDYYMDEDTFVNVAAYGDCGQDDELTADGLEFMLTGRKPDDVPSLQAQLAAAEGLARTLREALRPFADMRDAFGDVACVCFLLDQKTGCTYCVARAALSSASGLDPKEKP